PALLIAVPAAGDDLGVFGCLRVLDVRGDLAVRGLVDDRAREVAEVARVAHPDLLDHPEHAVPDFVPEGVRDVDARDGAALLALVLEASAYDRDGDGLRVRALVRDDEILAARLAHDPRIARVPLEVLGDLAPEELERLRRAGEVEPGELGALQQDVADRGRIAREEVDDARRQPGRLQEPHDVVVAEDRGVRRLPDRDVPHDRRRGRQVAPDRREVERADGVDEALEWPVIQAVPHPGRRVRLLRVDLRRVPTVEAPEVDQLARAVDLRLERRLALTEHGRRVDRRAPGSGQELGCAEEDGDAVRPVPVRPLLPSLSRRLDRGLRLLGAGLVAPGEDVPVVVRHRDLDDASGPDLLTA